MTEGKGCGWAWCCWGVTQSQIHQAILCPIATWYGFFWDTWIRVPVHHSFLSEGHFYEGHLQIGDFHQAASAQSNTVKQKRRPTGRGVDKERHLTDMKVTLNVACMFLAVWPGGGGLEAREAEGKGPCRDMSGSDWKVEWSGNWAQQIHLNCARAINYQESKRRHTFSPSL